MEFMYIQDAVQAVYELYRHSHENPSAIVNVAGGDTRPLKAFVEEIHEIAGGRGELEYGTFVQAKEGLRISVRIFQASGIYQRGLEGGVFLPAGHRRNDGFLKGYV